MGRLLTGSLAGAALAAAVVGSAATASPVDRQDAEASALPGKVWILATLAGKAPREYRLAEASLLDGLFDAVPDLELPEHVLRAAGVRTRLEIWDDDDAEFVLERLGDPDRAIADAVVLRAYAALPEGDFAPPERVRVLSGEVVAADDVLC